MKKICKYCHFWKRNLKKIHGTCSNDNFIDISESSHYILATNIKENQLGYLDSDGYKAHFVVGESFGCIHFKNKEI